MVKIFEIIGLDGIRSLNRKIRSFFSTNENNTADKKAEQGPRRLHLFEIFRKSFLGAWLFSDFCKNLIVRWLLAGTIFLNVSNWVLMAVFIRPVDFKIILHYNVYFGVDLIGDWWQPYILPSMGTLFLAVNLMVAHRFYGRKERIASYILLLASLMIQAGLIIASSATALINY